MMNLVLLYAVIVLVAALNGKLTYHQSQYFFTRFSWRLQQSNVFFHTRLGLYAEGLRNLQDHEIPRFLDCSAVRRPDIVPSIS